VTTSTLRYGDGAARGIESRTERWCCRCTVPFVLAMAAFGVWRNRTTTLVAAVCSWVWLGLQGLQWWPAYLFDADAEWYADHGHDETTRWLPRIGDNQVVIDAQHTVLQSL